MTEQQTYICFDTNVYVHCALTNASSKLNSGYLRRIFKDMDEAGVKLLVPEVVRLELRRVLDKQIALMVKRLKELQAEVEGDGLLGWKTRNDIKKTIKRSKKALQEEADALFEEFEKRADNPELSLVVPFSEGDIVNEAIRLALRGESPAASDNGLGLLQGDCLIAATIHHVKLQEPNARVILCSDNVNDFAKDAGEGKFVLNDCLTDYIPGLEYCRDPGELYDFVLDGAADRDEIEPLKEEYKRVSVAPRYMGLADHWSAPVHDYFSVPSKTEQDYFTAISQRAQTATRSLGLDSSGYRAMHAGQAALNGIYASSPDLPLTLADYYKDGTIFAHAPERARSASFWEDALFTYKPPSQDFNLGYHQGSLTVPSPVKPHENDGESIEGEENEPQ